MMFKDKLAVVTGASRGIGYATSVALAREGAHVIAIARTVGSLEALDDDIKEFGGRCTLVPLDITDYDALDRLGEHIVNEHGVLDILIGNAAILGDITPISHLKPKVWSQLLDLNVTANYRLIRSLDPLLRAAENGRAVFVGSSNIARNPQHFWGGYAMSKAALECMVKTYALEVEKSNLRVNILNPGAIRTAMRARAVPGEDPLTLDTPKDLTPLILKICSPDFQDNGKIVDYRKFKNGDKNIFF